MPKFKVQLLVFPSDWGKRTNHSISDSDFWSAKCSGEVDESALIEIQKQIDGFDEEKAKSFLEYIHQQIKEKETA